VDVEATNSRSNASKLPFTAKTKSGWCFHWSATNRRHERGYRHQ
jgi:hypothetical protein